MDVNQHYKVLNFNELRKLQFGTDLTVSINKEANQKQ